MPSEGAAGRTRTSPTVSVILPIVVANELLQTCLRCIQSLSPAPDEVIVVVDGGDDELTKLAAQSGATVLKTPARSGPAVARNLGSRAARGDLLLFIDSDVAVPPSIVGDVARLFRDHPEISAAIGSYDDSPQAANLLSQYKNLLQHYVHQHAREEGYTFWGACGAIRREVFLQFGGYDERYRLPSIEDIELGYRLKAAGHRIRVCKDFQVKHLKRWSPVSLFKSDFFRRALPWTALILRTGGLENDLNIDRSSRLKVVLVFSLVGVLGLSWWWPAGLILAALFAAALLVLDAPLLRFFRQKRGTLFAIRTIPWHWFYYGYSGLAFAIGLTCHTFRRKANGGQ